MQSYSDDGVRQERTNWRDKDISNRHRMWGFNCPCVDLDFLVVEYNVAKPCALIEYKHYQARRPDVNHATYRALAELADIGDLPFAVVFYWPDTWAFSIRPINDKARETWLKWQDMTEREYVGSLYKIRRLVLNEAISKKLNDIKPPYIK